ncbi:hypothetical protein [Paraliomyxa miuraensis]|uniref:hypothetical protein n=1 Tax=Paraliomyxa miuraensis TaxID=376150 RepID=UPI00225C194B|nr:hypothetical protein [Paraliomyxa miuraensis]MCX4239604.1 hypothetical protein [Paraliomyxa miuraensis]
MDGEDAANVAGPPLGPAPLVDVDAWIEWCLAGLEVCAPPRGTSTPSNRPGPWVPTVRDAVEAGRRFAANFAVVRHGSISQAAVRAETSRQWIRRTLKRAGTYQPPAYMANGTKSKSTQQQRRRASEARAVDALAELGRGMTETSIATASRPVRVHMTGDFVRIEIEGEASIHASQRQALRVLTTTLVELGGPIDREGGESRGNDGGNHAR